MQPNVLAGKRVLIAEDEPVIAMDHAEALTQAGAEVVATCSTVRGAVDCIRDRPIDVAVVDYVLADGNSEPALIRVPWCGHSRVRKFCRSP